MIDIRKYINEYITYGMKIGYFNNSLASKFEQKLLNCKIEFDNELPEIK